MKNECFFTEKMHILRASQYVTEVIHDNFYVFFVPSVKLQVVD